MKACYCRFKRQLVGSVEDEGPSELHGFLNVDHFSDEEYLDTPVLFYLFHRSTAEVFHITLHVHELIDGNR